MVKVDIKEAKETREDLCMKEISDVFAAIIDEIGLQNALKISRIAGGSNLYIPLEKTIERPYRNYRIRKEFNGYNYRMLAVKYKLSESSIREICKDLAESYRNNNSSHKK